MCHFARRHGSWAQRAGTGRPRGGSFRGARCSQPSTELPCSRPAGRDGPLPGHVPAAGLGATHYTSEQVDGEGRETPAVAATKLLHGWSRPRNQFNWEEAGSRRAGRSSTLLQRHRCGVSVGIEVEMLRGHAWRGLSELLEDTRDHGTSRRHRSVDPPGAEPLARVLPSQKSPCPSGQDASPDSPRALHGPKVSLRENE